MAQKVNTMKKAILLGVLLLLASTLIQAVVSSGVNIRVSLINQEPDPVAPGDTVDVRFRIENLGGDAAKNVQVKVAPLYPFSLADPRDEIRTIGSVTGGQEDDLGVREKFTLLVDAGAVPGDHEVEFWYKIDSANWVKAGEFELAVQSRESAVGISKISSTPSPIAPGSKTKVSFTVENSAGSPIKDVTLNLNLYQVYSTSTGITEQSYPFTPLGSSNEKSLKQIDPGKDGSIVFDLFTDANAQSKAYKVPFTLSYADGAGNNFTKTGVVGLVVDAAPDVSVTLDSSTILQEGVKGTVTVKFVNKGFSDVKFLTVTLKETTSFDTVSNKEVYIGELDSDDYETADFDLIVRKGANGNVDLPVHVEFRDANGKQFERDETIKLRLFAGNDLKLREGKGGNSVVGIVIVVLIISAGVYFYRKRKRKHAA